MAKKSRRGAPPAAPIPAPAVATRAPSTPRAARRIAAALGLCYFLALGGHHAIVPTHIDWLMRNDWSQHYLGWAFFRATPWQWPLGTIQGLGAPVGTTVALTDANPLLALALRPMAPWLPDPFQYIGPYMALCMALQGYFGALLGQLLGARARTSLLCGCLFVLTPALLHRMDHDTLMGHWLILASIALALWQPLPEKRRLWLGAVWGISVLAALIHPYLLAMALPILLVAVLQHLGPGGLLPPPLAAALLGAMASTLALIAWALGYLGSQADWGTDGFGFFCADTTALFNPRGWSRLLPNLKVHRGQAYEGFGYLGLGLMALCAWGAGTAWRTGLGFAHRRRSWALVAVAVACLLFAWGPMIAVQGTPVVRLDRIYAPFERLCAMFRASGRFVWVPTYLVMTAALGALLRAPRKRPIDGLLGLFIVLQLIDVRPVNVYERLTQDPHVAMVDPLWQAARNSYDHVVLVPPHFPTSHVQCNPKGYREKIEMPPGLLAASLGMTVNSAYLSRSDAHAIKAYCDTLGNTLQRGQTDARSLYLVHPDYLPLLTDHGAPMVCFRADTYIGCVRKDRPTPLVEAVLAQKRQLM